MSAATAESLAWLLVVAEALRDAESGLEPWDLLCEAIEEAGEHVFTADMEQPLERAKARARTTYAFVDVAEGSEPTELEALLKCESLVRATMAAAERDRP